MRVHLALMVMVISDLSENNIFPSLWWYSLATAIPIWHLVIEQPWFFLLLDIIRQDKNITTCWCFPFSCYIMLCWHTHSFSLHTCWGWKWFIKVSLYNPFYVLNPHNYRCTYHGNERAKYHTHMTITGKHWIISIINSNSFWAVVVAYGRLRMLVYTIILLFFLHNDLQFPTANKGTSKFVLCIFHFSMKRAIYGWLSGN